MCKLLAMNSALKILANAVARTSLLIKDNKAVKFYTRIQYSLTLTT